MEQQSSMNDYAAKSLGSANSYAVYTDQFDASLLNPMPRSEARKDWDITGEEFTGVDTWHCHEATFLLTSGAPIAGTIKFSYSSGSEFMVESKSAKLYMNSFDMCKMGNTVDEAITNYVNQIQSDLEHVLNTPVYVHFFESGADDYSGPVYGYQDLHKVLRDRLPEIECSDYTLSEQHLKVKPASPDLYHQMYFTNVLRSRCRHTKQKDTGAAYVHLIVKDALVDPESLYKYIVSLREVNEFHEFCCEKLFIELMKLPEVVDCCVTLLYSRRGSLDINPVRASDPKLIPVALSNVEIYTKKAMGQ